ncbi:MAG: aldo/keto reductase [Ardenticatenaceae bacterium]|nr:aldo/keto reductase [Ardenticatenaceae bacterium]HBY96516.1 aldo/keto reductase [Chloroflexota bacterium]
MEYRSLGRTGIQVSVLALGSWLFGSRTGTEEAYTLVARALDRGINFIDTANNYNAGQSETILGEALKRSGGRERIILATKVHRAVGDDLNDWGNSRRHIIMQCEASLRRLQTDYLDLYQIHRPQSTIPIDETLRALDDLIRSGKVRYIGTSTFAAWQVVESLWVSKELGLYRVISEQPPYNILDRRVERELLPMARTYGLAVVPWSPLAGGILTGKYRLNTPPPLDSRLASADTRLARRVTPEALDVVEKLRPLAAAHNCTVLQFALAWITAQPGVTSALIGPRTVAQLEENLASLPVTLTEADLAGVDRIVPPGQMIVPYYDADFGPHQFRW